MPSVLIVDDLIGIHEMLAAVIQPTGYSMAFAQDGYTALEKYKSAKFDVVLADISMKPMDGITLLQQLRHYDHDCVTIMMTGCATTESAIKALKHGAFDYIQKPFKIEELIQALKRGVEFRAHTQRNHAGMEEGIATASVETHLIGQSAPAKLLAKQVGKLVDVQTPILLHGEVGTGKRAVAEFVHTARSGEQKPFVVIDCAHTSAGTLRNSLLGNSRGGGELINRAQGGCLFIQNIESLNEEMQAGFVSVLKHCINHTRIICSTTINLEKRVEEGLFSDELFYRIAILPIHMPPLRERVEDIPLLVKHFTRTAVNPQFETAQIEFAPETLQRMAEYSWPLNILELKQVTTSIATTTSTRIIQPAQLSLRFSNVESWPNLETVIAHEEGAYIRRVMRATGGDRERALRVLGCNPTRLDSVDKAVAPPTTNKA